MLKKDIDPNIASEHMNKITRTIETWESCSLRERITWNPCNCHPNDVMREYGPTLKNAVSYVSQQKAAFTKWMKKRGYVRIDRIMIDLNKNTRTRDRNNT